jgi:hypothetical protein
LKEVEKNDVPTHVSSVADSSSSFVLVVSGSLAGDARDNWRLAERAGVARYALG